MSETHVPFTREEKSKSTNESIQKLTIRCLGPISIHIEFERPFGFRRYENPLFTFEAFLTPIKVWK